MGRTQTSKLAGYYNAPAAYGTARVVMEERELRVRSDHTP